MKKHKTKRKILAVSQEHPMGCAVACVAARCNFKYQKALKLFANEKHAWTRGFFCNEIVEAFDMVGIPYTYKIFDMKKHLVELNANGTIAFVDICEKYPAGHFFLKTESGWMNPWANYPSMVAIKPAFENKLPGLVSYIIYEDK